MFFVYYISTSLAQDQNLTLLPREAVTHQVVSNGLQEVEEKLKEEVQWLVVFAYVLFLYVLQIVVNR